MTTIRDLCLSIGSGATPSRKRNEYFSGSIPWLKTRELADAEILDTEEHISKLALSESSCKLLPPGTVVMAMYGATVGRLGMMGREMTTNQACCAMVADPKQLDNRYLFYWLKSNRQRIRDLSNGAAQQNLSVRTIGEIEIDTPPIENQTRVGIVLGSLDDKIAANRATASLSRFLIRSIAEGLEKQTPLAEFAVRNKRSLNPSKMSDELVLHFSIPRFDAGSPIIEPADAIKSSKIVVQQPCVLVSKLNPETPRVWSVSKPPDDFVSLASTEFISLEPDQITQSQLYAATLHPDFHQQLASLVGGTSKSHQRVKPDEMLQCLVPDVRELSDDQIRLLETLSQLEAQAVQEMGTLAKTRDELLPLLMSGKITVKEAEQEATSAGADIAGKESGA